MQWASPPLGDGPFFVESAASAHRNLRVVLMARLEQPWSIAFLPGGDMLVTERVGRLRLIKGGKLDSNPVRGIPAVRSRGLQGLMDVVLHPQFAQNRFVYFSYHRPVGENDGETMLARGIKSTAKQGGEGANWRAAGRETPKGEENR